jgi:hypothetical protein
MMMAVTCVVYCLIEGVDGMRDRLVDASTIVLIAALLTGAGAVLAAMAALLSRGNRLRPSGRCGCGSKNSSLK